jgi:hypothetical protein
MTPRAPRARSEYVDFVFGLDYLSTNSTMLRLFHEAMSHRGLSLLLVNKSNVEQAIGRIRRGQLRPTVYLDLCSRPGEPFWDLLHVAADAGIHTIRKPADEKWIYKARAHPLLAAEGFPLPPTVIFRPEDPDRELADDERARIGEQCVIKPSFGEACKGVKLRQPPTRQAIAAARDYDRRDDWLVQTMIPWGRCGDRPAYWRVYHIAGARSILWWSHERRGYDLLTWDDVRRYDLMGVLDIASRMSRLTGMDFFSTEVAAVDGGPQRFYMIDYCNDECDIDPEGGATGSPPHAWTRWVYRRFADFTWHRKHGLDMLRDNAICLPQAP